MKRPKLYGKQAVYYSSGHGVFRGVVFIYREDRGGIGRDKLTYVLRAGKKGTGREVGRAWCTFCASEQQRAWELLKRQAGGSLFDVADSNA